MKTTSTPTTTAYCSAYEKAYQESIHQPEQFWMKHAKELPWYTTPTRASKPLPEGTVSWFPDGVMNTCYMALDAHIEQGRGNQTALIYDSPVTQTKRNYTYFELCEKVAKLAGALKKRGVTKGDTVVIYMPAVPEAVMAMLACARLGAIHSVVFGGFAPKELAMRIDDAQPNVVISASCGIEVNRVIAYQPLIDEAIALAEHPVREVLMLQRDEAPADLNRSRYTDLHEAMQSAMPADPVAVNASDPLYVLYTSGTTGKPKGIVRENGGHAVALHYSMKYVYDMRPGQVFWAASDVGWVVGHSYIVYAPLLYGAATVLFEGKPIKTPNAGTFWRIIEEYRVSVMFTAPTAIRAIRKEDPDGRIMHQHDLSSLRLQFLAGERCDVATYNWLKDQLRVPVIDHWWQTESGWPMLANMAGYCETKGKPGSVAFPVVGYDLEILREDGTPCDANEEGYVMMKLPLPPSCLNTIWNNHERFKAGYLSKFKGYYFSGDGGYQDEDGYVYITGRIDDVINVAGHRLSTAEIEEVVASHENVAECAVIGKNDELKGQVPMAFVVLKSPTELDSTVQELINMVRRTVGAIANLKQIVCVMRLPKTRSGKTLRKTLRAMANGKDYTIPSTIDDPAILNEIKEQLEK